MNRYTIHDCSGDFPKDDACLSLMRDALYPDGIECCMCSAMTKHDWMSTWSLPTARTQQRISGRCSATVSASTARFRGGPRGDCVNEYAFRYNHRDDPKAMFSAVVSRVKKVRSGKYGEYSPIGEG